MTDGGLPSWSEYQEEVADFFRALGLTADTNVTVVGVRTSHDIDVRVSAHFAGVDLLWVVECKQWKRRVTKNHVLALHTIIQEIGADRGFMMAENGYQAGAVEAAASSNITLTSLVQQVRWKRSGKQLTSLSAILRRRQRRYRLDYASMMDGGPRLLLHIVRSGVIPTRCRTSICRSGSYLAVETRSCVNSMALACRKSMPHEPIRTPVLT